MRLSHALAFVVLAGCGADASSSSAPEPAGPASADGSAAPSEGDGASRAPLDAGSADAHDAGAATDADARPLELDVDQMPWQTGTNVGFGVAHKDTGNPRGENVFIAYAGFAVSLDAAKAWATALYRATLKDRGVRWIWAVQGPDDPEYVHKEIGNSKIVTAMLPTVAASTRFVLVAGHSSGSFVAHELLGQLAGGLDPNGVTDKRVVYFNLDGGQSGLTPAVVARLRRAYFVGSHQASTATYSPNAAKMQDLAVQFPGSGGYYENQANGSGCNAGAPWCVHVTLITTHPHDPANADPLRDYSDFVGRPVCSTYIDAKAAEADLAP